MSGLVLSLVVAATAVTFSQSGARSPLAGDAEPYPNFDIRTYKDDPRWEGHAAFGEYMARFRPSAALAMELAVARVSGVVELEAAHKGVAVEKSPLMGTTEIVSAAPGGGFLTAPSGDRVAALRGFLTAHADAYGISAEEAGELAVVSDYTNPAGNMGWAELEQRFGGIPVFQGRVRGGFTAKGQLTRTTGLLATGIEASSLSRIPSVSSAQAVSIAAGTVGWKVPESSLIEQPSETANRVTFARGTMSDEAKAWLVYFPLAPGVARLAWATEVWGDPEAFLTVIDAETGTMLFRKNMTEYQTQSATYVVYSSDSPAPASPTTSTPAAPTQAPYVARQSFTLIGNEGPLSFNNLGWMTDGTNGANGHTDGNNVEAGLDRDGTNGVDAPVAGVGRVFNFAYNPETDNPLGAAYQMGDVTNMFYWVNRYHDSTYLLGFTEPAFNFQNDNFGRGGVGNDRVSAEGQDSSGTNNANFATPSDGGRGRMQMFLWTGPTPDRSGDLDQDVIYHELTHGTSNRLHANAAGLSTNMARGMGEGWSDFIARALLSDATEDVNGIYTIGGWVTHQLTSATDVTNYYYGIRRFPYAPRAVTGGPLNRPHSPLTFADIDSTQADLSDGAFARGPVGSSTVDQVHNIGEVWAGMLWEVRHRFITRLGWATGNQRILQFVMDGMKLDPIGPTLIQARDAIIAAANAGGGTAADIADIWDGFATRGLGTLASVTNAGSGANNTRVVESFLRPGDPTPTFNINDVSQNEGNAGTTTFTFTVSLANASPGVEHRVSYSTANGTATGDGVGTTFTTATPTTIPAGAPGTTSGPASPYPLNLLVSGLTGNIIDLDVRIDGLTHTFPGDLDLLLVAPGGQAMIVQSDAGGGGDVTGVTYTLDDQAASPMSTTQITPGSFQPYNSGANDPFDPPAPAGPYANPAPAGTDTLNGIFGGTNPNGTWTLYIDDDAGGDVGSMNGFSLIVTVPAPSADYVGVSGQLVFPPGTTSQPVNVTVNGDTAIEPNETFFVNLSAPINAVIGDGQGVGTILNDDGSLAPTTVADGYATPFNTPLVVGAPGVLGNDSSNGGGAMTAELVTTASSGTLALNANGSFTYTPNAGFVGADSFTYRAVNAGGPGNVATVSLTVNPGAPTTTPDNYGTPFNTPLVVGTPGVLGNDTSNNGAMTAELVTNATNGVAALNANGSFTYTPNAGFVGADSFTYRAVNSVGPGNSAAVTVTVAAPTTVQPPFNLRVDSVVGLLVTLRWDVPTIGPQPAFFVLEGGINPGEVLASIPTGSNAPVFTFVAPTGSFFIRMHGQLGADKSPASNEVPLHVNVPVPPSAPSNLTGMVNGSSLALAWKNTFGGGPPSGLVLDVTGSLAVSLPLGLSDSFAFAGVPGGTYTMSLRATNAGGSSPASNAVTLTFPGACSGAPQVPANFVGYKIGNTVFVLWDAPASGPAPTGYVLNVTGAFVGSFPTPGRSMSGTVGPGTYNLTVQATNPCGASAASPVQVVTVP